MHNRSMRRKGLKKKKGEEKKIEEILTENFPNLIIKGKIIILHIQEAQQTTNTLNTRTTTPWHIIVKLSVTKDGAS